jgi:hypothetical protein
MDFVVQYENPFTARWGCFLLLVQLDCATSSLLISQIDDANSSPCNQLQ